MSNQHSLAATVAEKALRIFFRIYFRLVHRIKIEGLENVPKNFDKLIVIANHASYVDGPLIWAFLGLNFKILVDRVRAQDPLIRPFMQNRHTVQIDPLNSLSLKGVIKIVKEGTPLLVFPEGRRTTTGSLMKIYEGTGFMAYKTGAKILPIYLKNTDNTITASKPGPKKFFPPLTMTIGKLQEPIKVDHLPPKLRKKAAANQIYKMLTNICFLANDKPQTLAGEFIRVCRERKSAVAFKDITRKEVSYKKSLTGAFAFADYFADNPEKNIGILLPNLTVTVLLFIGLLLKKKVPAFLNYSSGATALKQAVELADLKTIITSREFLNKLNIDPNVFADKNLIYIEEIRKEINFAAKLKALWKSRFPQLYYSAQPEESQETALILFTSGSEGVPKGVCLSHENILTNIYQSLASIDVRQSDFFLNALPLFHSFGLTVGTLLPLFAGAKVFLYLSPLHYRVVPEIAYDQNCTVMLGTNTFLNGFSKKAHPYDFYSMRYIFCGAEALTETVFNKYAKTYGIRVMSGYGATECSPTISINNSLAYEHGTVGKFLPGIEHKLIPVEGLEAKGGRVGRLYVRGKNVMKGYLKNEAANHKYLVEDQGWYDTGDIVEITETGFLKIVGRMKRFAKISGEMVSLTAIEEALAGQFGDRSETAILAVPDEKKGEKLILIANNPKIDLKEVREILKTKGLSELAQPREIRYIKEIPKLGTGKVDYMKLKEMMG